MRVALWMLLGLVASGCDAKRRVDLDRDGGWFADVDPGSLRPDSGATWVDTPSRPQAGKGGGYAPERDGDAGGGGRGSSSSAGSGAAGARQVGGAGGGGTGGSAGSAGSSHTATKQALAYGSLVITELMADPDARSDAEGEWFELYNTTSSDADLAGCTIGDGGAKPRAIADPVRVAARSYATVAGTPEPGFDVDIISDLSLTNGAGVIELHCAGALIDRVAYDKAKGFPLAAGVAAALDPMRLDADANDEPAAWCRAIDAYASDRGTPGRANRPCTAGAADAGAAANPGSMANEPTEDPAPPPTAAAPALPYGAVVITEIMADPKALNDAQAEWFEVYNTTPDAVDLAGCAVDDGAFHPIADSFEIPAHAYATLASTAEPGFAPAHVGALSLTNSADVLELRCGETLIDRVAYDSAAGFPLAAGSASMLHPSRIDADANDDPSNWCLAAEAFDADFGTPGAANGACAAPTTAGGVDEDDGEGASEDEPAAPPADDPQPPPFEPPTVPYGAIVITEVMADPDAVPDAEGEWVELYNTTSDRIELRGCTIGDGSAEPRAIEDAFAIAAGDYATIASGSAPGFDASYVISLSLTNVADAIELRCAGELVDRVAYDASTEFPLAAGVAAGLDPARLDAESNDSADAWCAAGTAYATDRGTPGRTNDPCVPESSDDDSGSSSEAPAEPPAEPVNTLAYGAIVITEVMADPDAISDAEGEWVELYNATSDSVDLQGCTLGDGSDAPHTIAEPMRIAPGAFATLASGPEPGFSATLATSLSLTNSTDVIELRCGDELVDRVAYDEATGFPIAPGAAATLDPSKLDADGNDDPSAWCLADVVYATDRGTPGSPNDICAREPLDVGVEEPAIDPPSSSDDPLSPPPPTAVTLPYGALVITEFMADPELLSDADGEWFELYNATSEPIDLVSCTIAAGSAGTLEIASPLAIAAGDYATVARSVAPGFVPTLVGAMSLANGAGAIELSCAGAVVDRVAYDAAQGFPVITGAATLLDPSRLDADGNDQPSAWCAATTEYEAGLGTPGVPNPPCPTEAEPDPDP